MDHAKVWLKQGHEVTVVTCAPNVPRGVVFEGYENRWYQVETIDGIRVVRIWSYIAPNEGFLRRAIDYVSYMFSAVVQAGKFPEFDVVLATSPPLFTAVAGYLVAKRRNRPWVFEIRDLWPASIEAVGASAGGMMPVLERLELFLYRKADRIISLTQSFKRNLTDRGIPEHKNDVVMNSVELSRFRPESIESGTRERLGIPEGAFLVGYIGTIGMAHGLAIVVEAAERFRDKPDIHFLLLGDGAERAELETNAKARGLSNVHFRDFVPHEEMPSYLSALDASLVHLRPAPLFETVIPSKIFESMAMGVPILMGVGGEAADLVNREGAGACFRAGDVDGLVSVINALASDPEGRAEMSRRGREAALQRYSRTPNASAVIRTLEAAIASYHAPRGNRGDAS